MVGERAGATSVDVRLEGGGLKSIEVGTHLLSEGKGFFSFTHVPPTGCSSQVRDDGCGIPEEQVALAVAAYYTSKIQDFSSLETLRSYGFRCDAPHWIDMSPPNAGITSLFLLLLLLAVRHSIRSAITVAK